MKKGKKEGRNGDRKIGGRVKEAYFLLPFLPFSRFPSSSNYPLLAKINLPALSNKIKYLSAPTEKFML